MKRLFSVFLLAFGLTSSAIGSEIPIPYDYDGDGLTPIQSKPLWAYPYSSCVGGSCPIYPPNDPIPVTPSSVPTPIPTSVAPSSSASSNSSPSSDPLGPIQLLKNLREQLTVSFARLQERIDSLEKKDGESSLKSIRGLVDQTSATLATTREAAQKIASVGALVEENIDYVKYLRYLPLVLIFNVLIIISWLAKGGWAAIRSLVQWGRNAVFNYVARQINVENVQAKK